MSQVGRRRLRTPSQFSQTKRDVLGPFPIFANETQRFVPLPNYREPKRDVFLGIAFPIIANRNAAFANVASAFSFYYSQNRARDKSILRDIFEKTLKKSK